MSQRAVAPGLTLLSSSKVYFQESLAEALRERKVATAPFVESYLVELLEHYLFADHLYQESEDGRRSQDTLAEMLLRANAGASAAVRFDLLKRLGDSALYISGFFGDSLQRKIVDVDYYINMGSTAYISLAQEVDEDTFSQMYREIGRRFDEFVDVFTLMSRKSMNTDADNVLRLMDLYAKTGSDLAKDTLVSKGIFTNISQLKKANNQ